MLQDLLNQFQLIIDTSIANFHFTLTIIGILVGVQAINKIMHNRLVCFGILPRTSIGIPGIFLSPFVHGDFAHLFLNILPLFILMNLVLVFGHDQFFLITSFVIVVGNFLVWLLGRKALHIGASGVVFGYWGYLLMNAYTNFSALTIILAVICLYYFGSMFVGLFPVDKKTSWEAHLFGAIAGILASYLNL